MRVSEKEIWKRIRALEEAEDACESAYVVVVRKDREQVRELWVDGLTEALEGKIESVKNTSELGSLIEVMLH